MSFLQLFNNRIFTLFKHFHKPLYFSLRPFLPFYICLLGLSATVGFGSFVLTSDLKILPNLVIPQISVMPLSYTGLAWSASIGANWPNLEEIVKWLACSVRLKTFEADVALRTQRLIKVYSTGANQWNGSFSFVMMIKYGLNLVGTSSSEGPKSSPQRTNPLTEGPTALWDARQLLWIFGIWWGCYQRA